MGSAMRIPWQSRDGTAFHAGTAWPANRRTAQAPPANSQASLRLSAGVELTCRVQGHQIVAAADVRVTDIDLRHRSPAGARSSSRRGGQGRGRRGSSRSPATPLERSSCSARMQYGHTAVAYISTFGTTFLRIGCERSAAPDSLLATGMAACCQPRMPPLSGNTSWNPFFLSTAHAAAARFPLRQLTTIGRSLSFSSSLRRFSISAAGMWRAFGIWPGSKFGRVAHVEHDGVAAIDELHGLLHGHVLCTDPRRAGPAATAACRR